MQRVLLPALLATAALSFAASASAAEPRCQSFQVISTGEFRQQDAIDLDGNGSVSAGDHMIGTRVLVDSDGNEVGRRFFSGVVEAVDADGRELDRNTNIVNVFTDGAIFSYKQKVNGHDLSTTIVGGTGVFTGAHGSESTVSDGLRNTYTFELSCDSEPRS